MAAKIRQSTRMKRRGKKTKENEKTIIVKSEDAAKKKKKRNKSLRNCKYYVLRLFIAHLGDHGLITLLYGNSFNSLPHTLFNPLTAVSVYIRPDHFSCAKKSLKIIRSFKNQKSRKIHQTVEKYTKFDVRAPTVTKVTMTSKFT